MNPTEDEYKKELAVRFAQLPKAVQDSILSADVQKRLRELATSHKLHVDEWDALENEVMLTILGFQRSEALETNITRELRVTADEARQLALGINTIVFEPIRKELERQLEHPEAEAKQVTGIEAAQQQALAGEAQAAQAPSVQPATPPPPPSQGIVRAPASGAYKPGEPSTTRASIVDDPYRELPQ